MTNISYLSFLRNYRTRHYQKGEIILYQNEVPEGTYVIKNGIVKSYDITVNGEEKPIAFNLAQELFPIGWIFKKIKTSNYFYEAYSDCDIYIIPPEEYRSFLKQNSEYEHELFMGVINRYITYQFRIDALEQSKAVDKIIHTLHFLSSSYGSAMGKFTKIDLPLTQQDMANFMGLTRETTAIELKKLERLGVIKHIKRAYLVNVNKLKKMLGNPDDHDDDGLSNK